MSKENNELKYNNYSIGNEDEFLIFLNQQKNLNPKKIKVNERLIFDPDESSLHGIHLIIKHFPKTLKYELDKSNNALKSLKEAYNYIIESPFYHLYKREIAMMAKEAEYFLNSSCFCYYFNDFEVYKDIKQLSHNLKTAIQFITYEYSEIIEFLNEGIDNNIQQKFYIYTLFKNTKIKFEKLGRQIDTLLKEFEKSGNNYNDCNIAIDTFDYFKEPYNHYRKLVKLLNASQKNKSIIDLNNIKIQICDQQEKERIIKIEIDFLQSQKEINSCQNSKANNSKIEAKINKNNDELSELQKNIQRLMALKYELEIKIEPIYNETINIKNLIKNYLDKIKTDFGKYNDQTKNKINKQFEVTFKKYKIYKMLIYSTIRKYEKLNFYYFTEIKEDFDNIDLYLYYLTEIQY
jgi:hypothetical protein